MVVSLPVRCRMHRDESLTFVLSLRGENDVVVLYEIAQEALNSLHMNRTKVY